MGTYRTVKTSAAAAAMLLAGISAAQASVVLTAPTGTLTANSASETSSAGTPQRASWDLATVQDGGKTYELSDVSFVGRPATGCDGGCSADIVDVQVSFMAINEKGTSGTKGTVKNSPK